MRLRVICKKCDHIINFDVTKESKTCQYCGASLTIRDVRMSPVEHEKYLRYKEKKGLAEEEKEEPKEEPVSARQKLKLLKSANLAAPRQAEKPKPIPAVKIGDEALRLAESRKDRPVSDAITGRYVIHKGKTKYGHIEVSNPDYMILKLNFWTMGNQQKYIAQQLNSLIRRFLTELGFELKRV